MFDHLGHLLFLILQILLLLLLLILFPLLRSHLSELILLFQGLLAQLLVKIFLPLLIDLLGLGAWGLFAILFTLGSHRVGDLQAHHFVDHLHDDLQHLDSFVHRLLCRSNLNAGSHKDRILIVNLLVSDMQLVQTAAIVLQHVSNLRVNQLISDLFIFTQDDQMVPLRQLFGLFLVCRGLGHGQVVGSNGIEQTFEVLMHVHCGLLAGLLGQEELDWVGRRSIVVALLEQYGNVNCQYITGAIDQAQTVLREEAVTLV